MKLLLFGGTFDPPHIGHMNLLQNSIKAVRPDMVFVIPAGTPPHKADRGTPAETRLAMCACFVPLFESLAISDIEINQSGKSYTINTIRAIENQIPLAEIFLCIGSDSLINFTQWYKYKEILQSVVLVALCRKKEDEAGVYAASRVLRAEGGRVILAGGKVEDISSSEIRDALMRGEKSILSKIPPPADAIVRREGLYSAPQRGQLS